MLRKILTSVIVCLISAGAALAQTGSLSGTVTDATTGETLLSANIYLPSLQRGAATDGDGNYKIANIPNGTYMVRVTYVGYQTINKSVEISSGNTTQNFAMQAGLALSELVVTGALGEKQTLNSVTFSSQQVDSKQLNLTQSADIKTSIAGKVAGVQILAQAGSKLGDASTIRIRGQISLTSTNSDPLYVVDGVPGVDPNIVDMNNVKDLNVLKGPNATALYGQRGQNGVVIITTKNDGGSGVSVELNNSLTFDKLFGTPKFQNEYGQGYTGQSEFYTYHYDPSVDPLYFKPMDGTLYIHDSYADESWGPKLDGTQYGAWYNWFPDSPYYGQTTAFTAHPNNIKNFYDTGVTNKANFAVNYTHDNYSARISYSNLTQTGILPYTNLNKHFISGKFDINVTDAFKVGVDINSTLQGINGSVRADGYGNQTSGTFNNWFGRQISVKKLKELQDLKTPEGIQTSWNWWGPGINDLGVRYGSSAADNGLKKPAFWFNAYTWQKNYVEKRDTDDLLLNVNLSYQLSDNWELQGSANRSSSNFHYRTETPYTFEQSSDQTGLLYNYYVNNFGEQEQQSSEENYSGRLSYKNNFKDWSVNALAGTQLRVEAYQLLSAYVNSGYQSGGLIIPNVYSFSNSRAPVVPTESNTNKEVYSVYGRANVGYKDMLYINGSYREDWSSALPANNNGYGYPSLGASFVFSELLDSQVLSYGKIRAGWAQVGSDVGAEAILGNYGLSSNPYTNPITGSSTPLLYTDNTRIDPNIKPSISSSYEAGTDLRFYNDRLGFSATYYNETRKDDIIGVDISSATGTGAYLTNAGEVNRQGLELSLKGTPVQNQNFQWTTTLNFAHNFVKVTALPAGLNTFTIGGTTASFGFVNITHELGKEWGQLRGAAIKRDSVSGKPIINSNGLYASVQNHNFGSVLPDLTGGWVNNISYKRFGLAASVDFQKGGQFFSLTEQWAAEGGLLDYTAGTNDKGNPKRDAVADGGGVHVTGLDASGNAVDEYVNTKSYYKQWYANGIADPFVHDASYVKLREVSLSYSLPTRWFGGFLNSAQVSVVGRNLWLIAVSADNHNRWDPSELSQSYGENGQLPSTRSYGFNINVTF